MLPEQVRNLRIQLGIKPVYKTVDTCAAEFEAVTPYYYSAYDQENEALPLPGQKGYCAGQRTHPHRPGDRVRLLQRPTPPPR